MSLINFDYRSSRLALAGVSLLLAGGVVAAGCGGSDLSTLAGFCLEAARADCAGEVVRACWGSSDNTLETDVQSCIDARAATEKCNPSNLPYHPEYADACIAAHGNTYAASQYDVTTAEAMREACLAVFNKGGGEGHSCTDDVDCDVGSGLRCMMRATGKGSCRVPNPVQGGESCSNPSAQCPDGQYCAEVDACIAKPKAGAPCGPGVPCATNYRCNETSKKCEAQFDNGSSCKVDDDCKGGFCLEVSGGGSECAANYIYAFGSSTCQSFKR